MEPTSGQIGIGIFCDFQNLWIGIGIILVIRWVFANYSQIPQIFPPPKCVCLILFFLDSYIFLHLKNLPDNQSHNEMNAYSLCVFNIKRRYSWTLWQILMKKNNICEITIFANRKINHEKGLWPINIGIYLWTNYQRIYEWQIYLQTIHKQFANKELFSEH